MVRLIDADALIKDLEYDVELDARTLDDTDLLLGRNREIVQFDKDCKQNAVDMLKKAPTVDAEPVRHGKWIYGNDFHWYTASCNKCGYQRRTDIKADGWNQWRYCPNCGAKMDGGTNGSD